MKGFFLGFIALFVFVHSSGDPGKPGLEGYNSFISFNCLERSAFKWFQVLFPDMNYLERMAAAKFFSRNVVPWIIKFLIIMSCLSWFIQGVMYVGHFLLLAHSSVWRYFCLEKTARWRIAWKFVWANETDLPPSLTKLIQEESRKISTISPSWPYVLFPWRSEVDFKGK